jgi:hypothetical protein
MASKLLFLDKKDATSSDNLYVVGPQINFLKEEINPLCVDIERGGELVSSKI